MKVRNIFTGQVYEARRSFRHSASTWGQPIFILGDGRAVDPVFHEILEDDEGPGGGAGADLKNGG
jgi:hypothetical protein